MADVPASTHVRRRSVPNIDTDRLVRRRAFLAAEMPSIDGRIEFAHRATEMLQIEDELVRRGDLLAADRRTLDPASDLFRSLDSGIRTRR